MPPAPTEPTPPARDWPAIRHAYEATSEPRLDICARFDIASWQLTDRIAREDWQRRRPRPVVRRDTLKQRRRLIERLLTTLDAKLTSLEERMAKTSNGKPTDIDRDARELSAIVRGFEKVAEADDKLKRRHSRKQPAALTASADAVKLREELARRLVSLREARAAKGKAG